MLTLYIILGLLSWCSLGYLTAYIDFKFDIVDSKSVNNNLGVLILGGLVTFILMLCNLIGGSFSNSFRKGGVLSKLKFKDK
jgi:hypothetical protein